MEHEALFSCTNLTHHANREAANVQISNLRRTTKRHGARWKAVACPMHPEKFILRPIGKGEARSKSSRRDRQYA